MLIGQGFYTTFIFHIYTIFEFFFLSLFYLQVFGKKWEKIIIPLIVVFALLCIGNFLFVQNKIEFNTYTRPIEVIITMVYGTYFINRQNIVDENISWSSNGLNWINTGILVYYASNLFMFIFFNYLVTGKRHLFDIVLVVHDTLLITEYVLFAIGFSKCKTILTDKLGHLMHA
ncbi:hypothetical protein [Mucilaginibacter gynuensis]|uniref:hypothetical protein n=1 Tax=Mucilaginibacter gynuensis TaxID=1302236 RepID=UPI0031E7B9DC